MNERAVVFDLDGTLADASHRLHLINGAKKRWPEFFKACVDDAPIDDVILTLRTFCGAGFVTVIASGRSDEVRKETEGWLARYRIPYHLLLMRKAGDYRADHIVKREMLDGPLNEYDIVAVFDDRDQTVRMWREAGIRCYQVSYGDF